MKNPFFATLLLAACLASAQGQSDTTNAALQRVTNWVRTGGGKPTALFAFARTNGIPDSVTFDIATRFLAEAEAKVAATPVPEIRYSFDDLNQAMYRAGMVTAIFGGSGNRDILPFLEEKSRSPYEPVRRQAAIGYVKIAGIDATPFVDRILSGDDDFYGFNCKYLVAREFFAQIEQAEARKAPQEKIDAAYAMLIRQAQKIEYEGRAEQIDIFLCKQLPEYELSRQREIALARFLNSKYDRARRFFGEQHAKVLSVPATERTDLRTRFPSLAETTAPDGEEDGKDNPTE
jgi:hypothetical protein